jgi:hypothetical protein
MISNLCGTDQIEKEGEMILYDQLSNDDDDDDRLTLYAVLMRGRAGLIYSSADFWESIKMGNILHKCLFVVVVVFFFLSPFVFIYYYYVFTFFTWSL